MKTAPALNLLEDVKKDFDTLDDAIKHVAGETGRSFYSVKAAYHRSRRGLGHSHANRKLTPDQETTLVAAAQAFSVNNAALSAAQMRELVARKWNSAVSNSWVGRFVRRHRKELSKRACKELADKRAGIVVYDGVLDFCEELTAFLKHNRFPTHAVFNFDETRVVQKGGNRTLSRVEAAGKARANVRSTRHCTVASLLTFACTDGGVLLSVYILKGRFCEGDEAPTSFAMEKSPSVTRGTWPRYYCWNDTGYLDVETFKAVLTKVDEVWHERDPGIPALLFGDQLAAHRRADVIEFALELGLFLFYLPKNTSHIIQPLDEAPFGALQAVTRRNHEAAEMDGMLTSSSTRDALLMAAYAPEHRALTRPVIIGALRRCGLWPFDPALMQANVRDILGMVSTGETAVEAARSAATAVIQAAQDRVAAAAATPTHCPVVVKKGEVHSPFLLLERHRQAVAAAEKKRQGKADRSAARASKKTEMERERTENAAARKQRRCRACADKEYRGGKAWTGYPCHTFWVCPGCTKSFQAGVAQHVKECPGPDVDRGSSSGEDDGRSSGAESSE